MKLLFINANVRGNESRTLKLTKYFISKYKEKNKDIKIETLNLNDEDLKPLLKKEFDEREFFIKNKIYNDKLFNNAKKFKEADKIIISAPYWNSSVPSILTVYIENVCQTGITYKYGMRGSEGLSNFSSLLFISSSGGKMIDNNYIKKIAEFLGNGKYYEVFAEDLDVFGNDVDKILNEAKLKLDEIVEVF